MVRTPNFELSNSADNISNSVKTAMIAQGLSDFLDEDDLSDDQRVEISEDEEVFTGWTLHNDDNQASDTAIGTGSDRLCSDWFPWPKTIINVLLWLLQVNNMDNVPSVKSIKLIKDTIQQLCGICSISYDGALGHRYYVNWLPDIIRQSCLKEMMNPPVRPLLYFYPEDAGKVLNEAQQAKHSLKELNPELLMPVVRLHNQNFFVFEPALLSSGQAFIPFHWFMRGGKMYTQAWSLWPVLMNWIVVGL
ncbi:hypothetical protein BDR03DRAFT_1017715 [Suillus americanus]|nr:hypothetical protein BDR03DRAFT_1017715 [Suillus americanus]